MTIDVCGMFRPLLLAAPFALAVAGCSQTGGDIATDLAPSQPRSASYSCSNGSTIRIENRRSAVTVQLADADGIELPASPPGQLNRYGVPPYALVLEERTALFMVTGKEPVDCRR